MLEPLGLLSNQTIENCINQFFNDLDINNLPSDQYFNLIFKVYVVNFDSYRTIGYKFRSNKDSKSDVINYCIGWWALKTDDYKQSLCSKISFAYRFIPKVQNTVKNFPVINKFPEFKFSGYKFPLSMDVKDWGLISHNDEENVVIIDNKSGSTIEYHINKYSNRNEVTVKKENLVLIKFIDYYLDNDYYNLKVNNDEKSNTSLPINFNCFKRVINNSEYIIKDKQIILLTTKRRCKFIPSIKKVKDLNNKFLTMDLETRTINNILKPYCVSIFDGKIKSSFFLDDFNSTDSMLSESVKYLMIRKYHQMRVYLHNFSNFDSIFMINTLQKLSVKSLKPNRRNGKLIDVKFFFGKNYFIHFRDSYLLLPKSLKKLSLSFGLSKKGDFPHKFLDNSNIELNYSGLVPSRDFFYNLSESEYKEYLKLYKDKVWNLKSEAIKYCEQDVITLYKIIEVFNEKIFKNFKVNIDRYPTLPSLAFAIFRSNFLNNKTKIPIISGQMYNYFKQGYTGGSCDMFKPYAKKPIYRYDVNSLYPAMMKKHQMPLGNPIYFEGDILKFMNKPLGVFKVKIDSPEEIKHPILQSRLKVNGTSSTLSPLGSWEGVFFSEELYNAEKYGYKYQVLNGFIFKESDNIFKEYVDKIYEWKSQSSKDSADYEISKLLLNSLYGRFGMSPEIELHEIVEDSVALAIESSDDNLVTDITPLENDKIWISYININPLDKEDVYVNVSIPIALAITSYARIHMSKFKNKKGTLYYTDTDSIDIDCELESDLVGKELGLMKHEYTFEEACYIAPKVYGGILSIKNPDGSITNREVVKCKGYKNIIPYNELKSLLRLNNKLNLKQEKWYKDKQNSEIRIKNEVYSLMVTSNKRKLIYDLEGNLVDTKPYKLDGISLEITTFD